jgi:hypothetical protein
VFVLAPKLKKTDRKLEIDRLVRLIANHCARLVRPGRITTCACDLCRAAIRRLKELQGGARG